MTTTALKAVAWVAVIWTMGPGIRKTYRLPDVAIPHRHHN